MDIIHKNKQLCSVLYSTAACIAGIVILSSCTIKSVVRQEPPPPPPAPAPSVQPDIDYILCNPGQIYIDCSTEFKASINGFKFANTAPNPDPTFDVNIAKIYGMGLCVGMSLAAMDLFCEGYNVPEINEMNEIFQPRSRFTKFGDYLRNRQKNFERPEVLRKNDIWTNMDDATLSANTRWEFYNNLTKNLAQGQPAPLVLITSGSQANHMVVAVGYVYYCASKDTTIYIYDPNFRQQEQYLTFKPGNPGDKIELFLNGLPVRGFFVYDYMPDKTFPTDGLESSGRNNACPGMVRRATRR